MSRRTVMKAMAGAAGVAFMTPTTLLAQPKPMEPPSVITTPPRDFGPTAPPNVYFVDPDVITVDPSFNALRQANAPIQRLWTWTASSADRMACEPTSRATCGRRATRAAASATAA